MADKFSVEFSKDGSFSIAPDETILNAAIAAGIPLFHACGGNAKCSTCRVLVVDGSERLSVPNSKEKLLSEKFHFSSDVRLACQTHVKSGSVQLRRIIQDETDIGLYTGARAETSSQQIGEEKELVLFFLDLRDFTPFVERHLAFDIIHIIRKLFSVFQNIIESNKGKIIETEGDGLYAVFGCDTKHLESIQSAIKTAFSIITDIATLNETYFNTHFNETVRVGIGIHTGKVISGTIRIGNQDRMIIMGYPVNVASRLQNATKSLNNNLVISADVYDLMLNPPLDAESAIITLKGVVKQVKVYLLGKPYN